MGQLIRLVKQTTRRHWLTRIAPDLRLRAGTRLAEDGASASEIQHLLGHESLNTSQGYIDATAAEQRLAARANRTYRTLDGILRNPD